MATSCFHNPSSSFPAIGSPPCRPRSSSSSHGVQPRPPPARVTLVQWTPPRFGWTKLNFDGSVHNDGSGRASIGGAIRDVHGRVLLAFAERTPHAHIGVVEARALARGLRLALDFGCRRLAVEGDVTLVRLLRCESTQTRIPREMQDEIIALLGCFEVCEVQHTYREGNSVADALCKEAYKTSVERKVWVDRVLPFAVWQKVEDDRRGVIHERVRP